MDDLLNQAPGGFLSLSSDGTILMANETLAGWLASTPSELQGQSIKSILSMGGRVFYETHFWPQLKLQGHIEEIYFSLRSKSGAAVPILANAARHQRDGNTVYDCVVLRMRQRDQFETEIIRAKQAAEQANQAKANFLSMVSHELRTPLNAIDGFTQIIASGMDGPTTEAQQEDLQHIKNGSDQLLRLINDILNFARMEKEQAEAQIEAVDVESAMRLAEALVMHRLQAAGLQYHHEKREEQVTVLADPGQLQQILLNLLTNAIKFTPDGGTVSTLYTQTENQILIEVRDTGQGIPEEYIERIFEPFVQIDRLLVESSQRGLGLGLAISRELARAMNGDLTATSTIGEGSVFTLSLPKANP